MKKILLVSAATAALVFGSLANSEAPNLESLNISDFAANSNADDVIVHLQALQDIATANNNNREAGTAGFDLSSHYVAMKLIEAGYEVTLQPFEFDKYEKLSPSRFSKKSAKNDIVYEEEKDFNTMSYSPSGNLSGKTQAVDLALGEGNASTSGCEIEDFEGFVLGNVAVIQRGACAFRQKAENAQLAGASGVIIFNQGNDDGRKELFNGTLGKGPLDIPVFSVTYDLGVELANEGVVVNMFADTLAETKITHNVIAETKGGNADNIIMVGSHLDSVHEGPGINDNGSGSASILDVALRLKGISPNNKVRFAWWGAEEHGLVGSRHYSANLTDQEVSQIALYLNFDMVASPNYIYGIYDADGSAFEVPGPKGSAAIEKMFHDFFKVNGRNTVEVQANGRSDYVGFAERGIPFGGSFTGAEVAKTEKEVELFGGTLGESYDACYHKACDDMSNINREALQANLEMITFATLSFARSTEDVDREKSGQTDIVFNSIEFDPTVYPKHYSCHEGELFAQ